MNSKQQNLNHEISLIDDSSKDVGTIEQVQTRKLCEKTVSTGIQTEISPNNKS